MNFPVNPYFMRKNFRGVFRTMSNIYDEAFLQKQLSGIRRYPANIYLLKVNNSSTRKRCKIYSKLTIKTPARRQI